MGGAPFHLPTRRGIRSCSIVGEAEMTWNAHGSRQFLAHDRLTLPAPRGFFPDRLGRSGELGDGASASRFLSDVIETMIRRGLRSRLALSNRAIIAYQRFRSSDDVGSEQVRFSA